MVDGAECFAHKPCHKDNECNIDQRCCDVQCGIPICITKLQVPNIGKPPSKQPYLLIVCSLNIAVGSGCMIGDKHYSSGERSNISNVQLDCYNWYEPYGQAMSVLSVFNC